MNENKSIFYNKKVLITGHTGFKGSWLSIWMSKLGAKVIGASNDVPTSPAHYDLTKEILTDEYRVDITDSNKIFSIIKKHRPSFLFHLAAQPIVLESYLDPLKTFKTNTLGTINILDALKKTNHKCIALMITSDKCYDNVEWTFGYRESDRLGGKDPYSGSKGSAEIGIRSYVESFFKKDDSNILLGIGRAGNVIGGGDWASNRIVPDCIKSWSNNEKPKIRFPLATRPWQHVLEPLSGYITLAIKLYQKKILNGEAFNFGPPNYQNHSVEDLINEIMKYWPNSGWLDISEKQNLYHEAGLLKLNCDKALHLLNWKSTLNFNQTAKWTAEWYKNYYSVSVQEALNCTNNQIDNFVSLAAKNKSFALD
tara:strand:- start:3843 stop:4943 length:1101 start_codon:yes stop_codon:yes gene_type:complete